MSLINDALKKVSQAERGTPQAQPVDFETRAMQPTAYEKRPHNLLWISVALLAGVIAVATFVFAKQRQTPAVATTSPVVPKVAEVPKAKPTESKTVAAPISGESPKSPVVEAAPAAATTNTISPATPAPAAQAALTPAQPAPVPAGPAFRLKGILYTKNPTALINEASVHVGGEVDGATVTKIEATSVALDYEGKSITLKIAAK
jgi:hypothetical protein